MGGLEKARPYKFASIFNFTITDFRLFSFEEEAIVSGFSPSNGAGLLNKVT